MMDLSNFQLLKEDSDSYHVAHPNGRGMIVSKKGLSAKAHEAIKSMKVQKFDDGGGVQPQEFVPGQSYANAPLPGDVTSELVPEVPAGRPISPNLSSDPAEPAASVAPVPDPVSAPTPSAAAPASSPDPLSANYSSQNDILTKQQKEIEDAYKTESGAQGEKTSALDDYISKLPQLDEPLKSPQEIAAGYKKKNDELLEQFQGKNIEPDRYLHNLSTGSKISAAIAMVLSGIGNGIGGHPNAPNAALEILNKNINADIDAQKNDQTKAMTLWKMNREAMHSDLEANLATQNQLLTGVQAKTARATAASASAQQKLQGQLLINQLEQQKNHNNLVLGLTGQTGPGGFSRVAPEVVAGQLIQNPEEQKAALKEIGDARQTEQIRGMWRKSYKDLDEKALGGTFSPSDRQSAIESIAGMIEHKTEGRFNKEQAEAQAAAILPARAESADTRKNKLDRGEALFNSIKQTPTLIKNGINPERFIGTSSDPRLGAPATNSNEGQTASNAQGQRIVFQNGKWVPLAR